MKRMLFMFVVLGLVCGPAAAEDLASLKSRAEQGDASAQFTLGGRYFVGDGVPQDTKEAAKWLQRAADQGDVVAPWALGNLHYHGRDYAEATKWWRRAADLGASGGQYSLDAQFNLGRAYQLGEGVPQDFAESVKWSRRAGDRGHAAAQALLGFAYGRGEGVLQDYAESMKWLRRAADQGVAEAQLGLVIYYADAGVPTDYVEAYKWLVIATGSSAEAEPARRALAEKMMPEEIAKAQKLAREWQPISESANTLGEQQAHQGASNSITR